MWIYVIVALLIGVILYWGPQTIREAAKNSVPHTVFYYWGRGRRLYYYTLYQLGLLPKWSADQVLPGVFLGSARDATNYPALKENGVTHILSIASGFLPTFPDHFEYMYIDQLDVTSAPILHHFDSASHFINGNSGKLHPSGDRRVLVHCMQGISRSSTLIAAHLIRYSDMDTDKAIQFLKAERARVKPNSFFVQQLRRWESSERQERE